MKITGAKGLWELTVDGRPFRVKGVGVGRANGKIERADYLKLAKDLGANTVRTWGIDQGTKKYLDHARELGLYVDAGIWLDPAYGNNQGSYIHNEHYKNKVFKELIDYIDKYKDHPAILFWNIGNETIFWTKDEQERVTFCKFLEEIIREVHRIDPNHPVIYTTAFTTAVPYIREYVPSLDILGVNAYGGFDILHQQITSELNIPYMLTEYGPLGPWDRQKDMNGSSLEMSDDYKSHYYKKFAHKIQDAYGYCLGGFAFYLGDTTQVSHTWWNLTHGEGPKHAYKTIQKFYTGKDVKLWPPVIKEMNFSKRKDLNPGEKFQIGLEVESDSTSLNYEYFATTASESIYLAEYPNKKIPIHVIGSGKNVTVKAPQRPGLYRVYAVVQDGLGQVGVFNKSLSVTR